MSRVPSFVHIIRSEGTLLNFIEADENLKFLLYFNGFQFGLVLNETQGIHFRFQEKDHFMNLCFLEIILQISNLVLMMILIVS